MKKILTIASSIIISLLSSAAYADNYSCNSVETKSYVLKNLDSFLLKRRDGYKATIKLKDIRNRYTLKLNDIREEFHVPNKQSYACTAILNILPKGNNAIFTYENYYTNFKKNVYKVACKTAYTSYRGNDQKHHYNVKIDLDCKHYSDVDQYIFYLYEL